jgi:hypothetical protein
MSDSRLITPEHRKLQAFLGDWVGEERIAPSRWSKPGTAKGFASAVPEFGGLYVMQTYRQEREGAVSFEGRGLFGYDTGDRLYKLYWFDSLGFVPPSPASGAWKGDTLSLIRASARGAARHVYRFLSETAYTMRIEYAWEGDTWTEVLTGTYTRV